MLRALLQIVLNGVALLVAARLVPGSITRAACCTCSWPGWSSAWST